MWIFSAWLLCVRAWLLKLISSRTLPSSKYHDGSPHLDTWTTPKAPVQCICSPDARNLVICFDGTSHQFGMHDHPGSLKNTNVVELYSRLEKSERQLTYYSGGIATYPTPEWKTWRYYMQIINSIIDIAIAWTFDSKLLKAYKWLSINYRPGDRVFLFGFSRGGYLARALAGMIHEVGLLYKGDDDQIYFAYQLYASTKKFKDVKKTRAEFKKAFCRDHVCIHFAGLWDTVSSVGFGRQEPLPSTADGLEYICYVRHALALNEVRVKFQPDYVCGGNGPSELCTEERLQASGMRLPPHTKEVWFAGCHSDVGGAYLERKSDECGPALRWIYRDAIEAGLRSDIQAASDSSNIAPEIHSSLNFWWKLVERLPISHLSYKGVKPIVQWSRHMERPRVIRPRQGIHVSALRADDSLKLPWALLPGGAEWSVLREDSAQILKEVIIQ